ncbi:hypothetical protein JDW21_11250 [Bacillus subtilis]|uniref:Uncharacterized protein YdzX n=3 Tax=Bacillus subtilis subsp. subtilis TaxID=135461 RepID=YDZX_BACSU|nr:MULTISPECIES: hypothetical protein [Bacillales]YP_003097690.1 hypothetical protein BSU_06319 [Bacillus subtilis subsp. subtilis str. 168]C0H3X2.1 RecName: Full=Uncharacterized protein YdzX [Bacillus subtilis subsp. subtilis str. 168]MDP4113435.1 hypothetical protein [Bacillota bacterium]AFQ56551.1 YdzX [Bacillus subtilis QB928]AGG59984.1 YdzX [Bacillus subtilis subsp. subtilis 6051-HGW]AIC39011.1 hypothetical protein BSUA_00700 [Bacillus subtilis subsp. subtilis str. JH642 substr. AG174]A
MIHPPQKNSDEGTLFLSSNLFAPPKIPSNPRTPVLLAFYRIVNITQNHTANKKRNIFSTHSLKAQTKHYKFEISWYIFLHEFSTNCIFMIEFQLS